MRCHGRLFGPLGTKGGATKTITRRESMFASPALLRPSVATTYTVDMATISVFPPRALIPRISAEPTVSNSFAGGMQDAQLPSPSAVSWARSKESAALLSVRCPASPPNAQL